MDEDMTRIDRRADALVENDHALMQKLTSHRQKHRISQETVASRMGVSQPTVAAFERYDANPTLSTIRRYALAVGTVIEHHVIDDCVDHGMSQFEAVVRPSMTTTWSGGNSLGSWTTSPGNREASDVSTSHA